MATGLAFWKAGAHPGGCEAQGMTLEPFSVPVEDATGARLLTHEGALGWPWQEIKVLH